MTHPSTPFVAVHDPENAAFASSDTNSAKLHFLFAACPAFVQAFLSLLDGQGWPMISWFIRTPGSEDQAMRIKRFIALLLAALLAALLCGCVQRPGLDNYPYEPDTPAPDPLNGVFVSEGGSMRFNGDGSTVVLDLEEDFAARTGLPAGYSEGTYDFIQALPPHGHVSVRYDTAHNLDIAIGEGEGRLFVSLDIGYATEDGSSATVYVGAVTADSIPILLKNEGFVTVLFRKSEG